MHKPDRFQLFVQIEKVRLITYPNNDTKIQKLC
jgi:hypothetical protein